MSKDEEQLMVLEKQKLLEGEVVSQANVERLVMDIKEMMYSEKSTI